MIVFDIRRIETLLHMSESSILDFKQAQYPLESASDEQKSEFVKDLLAFANAWKTSDAHILIGVDETPGARATIIGVSRHHDDADLQQLVNGKTNVPVEFEYVPMVVDGKDIGVVRIAESQQRPVFLRKKFGRLEPNKVYIRRGSSTDVAAPDEIARMGVAEVTAAQQPSIALELCDPVPRQRLGSVGNVQSQVLVERPPAPQLSRAEEAILFGAAGMAFQMAQTLQAQVRAASLNRGPSKSELDAYYQELSILGRLGVVVQTRVSPFFTRARWCDLRSTS